MKKPTAFWQARSVLVVFTVVCAVALGVSVWHSTPTRAGSPLPDKSKPDFHARIRNGLGHEVQFATASASAEQVNGAVGSVASFIAGRSGLVMSDATRLRLAEMEQSSLKAQGHRITVEQLSDAIADALVQRLASVTDQEAAFAARTLETGHPGQIFLRANGEGYYKNQQFLDEVKSLRFLAQKNGNAARKNIYAVLLKMVKERVAVFSEAVPDQFGGTMNNGVTPLQAVLVTYSLAADDYLADSRDELQAAVRASEKQSRGSAQKTAYGVRGRFFSTPLNLIFNQEMVSGLLDSLAKGGNAK
jgi:hypothetical protein